MSWQLTAPTDARRQISVQIFERWNISFSIYPQCRLETGRSCRVMNSFATNRWQLPVKMRCAQCLDIRGGNNGVLLCIDALQIHLNSDTASSYADDLRVCRGCICEDNEVEHGLHSSFVSDNCIYSVVLRTVSCRPKYQGHRTRSRSAPLLFLSVLRIRTLQYAFSIRHSGNSHAFRRRLRTNP